MYDFEKVLAVFKDKKWFFSSVVETRLPEIDSDKIKYCLRTLRKSGLLEVRMGRDWNTSPPRYRDDPSGKTLQYRITEKGEDRISTNVTVKADYGSQFYEDDPNEPRYDVKSWYFEDIEDMSKLFRELVEKGEKKNSRIVREDSFSDQRSVFKIGGGKSLAVIIPQKHLDKLCLDEKDNIVFYYDENLEALLLRRMVLNPPIETHL